MFCHSALVAVCWNAGLSDHQIVRARIPVHQGQVLDLPSLRSRLMDNGGSGTLWEGYGLPPTTFAGSGLVNSVA